MNKFEVNKIIEIFHSKDWSDKYDFHNKKWKRNIWLKIGNIEDFNFVKDIINSDLKKINKNYKVSNWITFLIYKEGDFFGRHKDDDFNLIDKEIECVIVDLNQEDERELNIRLNANTGEWDFDMLANEWNAESLEEWGLDIPIFMDEPSLDELIGEEKNKPATMKITFDSLEKLQKA